MVFQLLTWQAFATFSLLGLKESARVKYGQPILSTENYSCLAYVQFFTMKPIQAPYNIFATHMQEASIYALTRMLVGTEAKDFLRT